MYITPHLHQQIFNRNLVNSACSLRKSWKVETYDMISVTHGVSIWCRKIDMLHLFLAQYHFSVIKNHLEDAFLLFFPAEDNI
jgi:hypothetical protein